MTTGHTEYGDPTIARSNEILRTEVGSGLHGLAVAGTDDHDEMGVYIEPLECVVGLDGAMDRYVWRTQPEGARSGHGDTDLVMYSLRKYLRLAVAGNPTVLCPLFAPETSIYTMTPLGAELVELTPAFLSRRAVSKFLGYLDGQVDRMNGRGKQNRVPNRPELVERYGYDVKYASHALRLAYQGLEIAEHGTLTLPMPQEQREHVRRLKTGGVATIEAALADIDTVRSKLVGLLDGGNIGLAESPDVERISQWSVDAHQRHWRQHVDGNAETTIGSR